MIELNRNSKDPLERIEAKLTLVMLYVGVLPDPNMNSDDPVERIETKLNGFVSILSPQLVAGQRLPRGGGGQGGIGGVNAGGGGGGGGYFGTGGAGGSVSVVNTTNVPPELLQWLTEVAPDLVDELHQMDAELDKVPWYRKVERRLLDGSISAVPPAVFGVLIKLLVG
jgi:hypothetical protein